MNINELLFNMKSSLPVLLSSCCIVNGEVFPLAEVEKMGCLEFGRRSIINMPLKLYKFFPNTTKKDDSGELVNYSQLALKNNTVFLQSPTEFDDVYDSDININYSEYVILRLREYCKRCKIEINDDASAEELGSSLAQHCYIVYSDRGSFDSVFKRRPTSELEKLSNQAFCLRLQLEHKKGNDLNKSIEMIINSDYDSLVSDLRQTFRVSCFATSPYSQLMWGGAYADFHKGFCLEYTVLPDDEQYKDILYSLFPMVYCKSRPNMTAKLSGLEDQPPTEEKLWDIYFHGALRKSIDWAYQNEWRLLLYMGKQKDPAQYNVKFFPVTKVFLGNRMPAKNRKEIIDICKQRSIPYVGVTRSPNMFEMCDCKTLCEDCLTFRNGLNNEPI